MSFPGQRRRAILTALLSGTVVRAFYPTFANGQLSRADYHALQENLITGEIRQFGEQPGRGLAQPGSIVKLITAATALDCGVTNPTRLIHCPGWLDLPAHPGSGRLSCWTPEGHGSLSLAEAIGASCNIHFYRLGMEIGLRRLIHGLDLFGISMPPSGVAPLIATGEDPALTVTAHQVLNLVAIIACRGQRGQSSIEFSPDIWNLLHLGMSRATTEGTGKGIAPAGVSVAAKTGTIHRNGGRSSSGTDSSPFQSWVVAFWPTQSPEWAMALHLQRGRAYEEAIPLARELIGRTPPQPQLR